MLKKLLFPVFLIFSITDMSAQFNSIYRSNVAKDEPAVESIREIKEPGSDEKDGGFFSKGIFKKIKGLFVTEKDSVPLDPNLFSYDKPEGDGFFIFTEKQEKEYLDSLKIELIKKRHDVLLKRTMMSLPMDTLKITSPFGYRTDPFTGERKFHNGIDFRARNYFIYPVLPGIVVKAGFRGGYGFCIEVQHGEMTTIYAHLSYILVQEKQVVPAGEPIGISGTTGRSTGEHLHFGVTQNGKFINPSILLEYIVGELADKNHAKEELLKERELLETDMKREKKILEELQVSENEIKKDDPTAFVIYGGVKGRNASGSMDERDSTCVINVIAQGKTVTIVRADGMGNLCDSTACSRYEKVKNEMGGVHIQFLGFKSDTLTVDSIKVNHQRESEVVRTSTGTRILFKDSRKGKEVTKEGSRVKIHTAKE